MKVKLLKGVYLQVRISSVEKQALVKACELQGRSISNFLRVAMRARLLEALGKKELAEMTAGVKE